MAVMPRFEEWATLPAMFFDQAARLGGRPMLRVKRDGDWVRLSWAEVRDQVVDAARGLAALGVKQGDRVCIVAENRPEWLIADFAIMSLGAITVPAYTTVGTPDYVHILRNSGACVVIVSGKALARKVYAAATQVGCCRTLVAIGSADVPADPALRTLGWDALLEKGAEKLGLPAPTPLRHDMLPLARGGNTAVPAPDEAGEEERRPPHHSALDPEELSRSFTADRTSCIIYTSGTGGLPKGVMLSHRAVLANCIGAFEVLDEIGLEDEVFLSCLPLSHAYEHSCGQMFPVFLGAEIAYVESIDKLAANLGEVKPSIVLVVPRLMEVVQQRMVREVQRQGGYRQKLFNLALELGKERYRRGGRLPFHRALLNRAMDRLVRARIGQKLGGRIKALVSGGAALNEEVGLFFDALGVRLLQGYGQTEAAPLISVNRVSCIAHHTVGPPVKGCEVVTGEDGEILVRGPNVMNGYWEDESATERALIDGWLHTGDVGHFDEKGRIVITDRKKDLLVTSGGDNVSPARVESQLTLEPEIAQAVVCGDRRPYIVALVVPDHEIARAWARRRGKPERLEELVQDPDFRKHVADAVDRANKGLSGVERIRKFRIVADPFTMENGLMTPTMKIKRNLVVKQLQDQIDGLYEA
ncbi:AMP-dependent synthetase/ligase [Indioceanicola profundi]|uniref:AMP-dependent synthetase/ligase n=1 Tax=Indioceanicola profundi TaxID=2220096 RepID=UPI00196902E5|nr:long-chain fatty acid--CoA ligase [Indioceanicola profundi]